MTKNTFLCLDCIHNGEQPLCYPTISASYPDMLVNPRDITFACQENPKLRGIDRFVVVECFNHEVEDEIEDDEIDEEETEEEDL